MNILATPITDWPTGKIIPRFVKRTPCAGCETLLLVMPSSVESIKSGAKTFCPRCHPSNNADAVVVVGSQQQFDEFKQLARHQQRADAELN